MLKKLAYFVIALLIISCGSSGTSGNNPENPPDSVDKEEPDLPATYRYKQGDSYELNLTVFSSNSAQSKVPAVVFFFGGGWGRGSTDQFKPHAQYFAQRGAAGILVDYRVSSRNGTTPFDAVEDAKDALKFIFENADTLGIDNRKVVASGGSAGGHLALISSFLLQDECGDQYKPSALVLFNPVVDTGPQGYGYDIIGDNYRAISPIDNIPENPSPMIYFQGTADNIVNAGQAEAFCDSVVAKNDNCNLKLHQGQGHGFFNYKNTEYFIQTVREADQFLIQQQLIEGEPNVRSWLQEQN